MPGPAGLLLLTPRFAFPGRAVGGMLFPLVSCVLIESFVLGQSRSDPFAVCALTKMKKNHKTKGSSGRKVQESKVPTPHTLLQLEAGEGNSHPGNIFALSSTPTHTPELSLLGRNGQREGEKEEMAARGTGLPGEGRRKAVPISPASEPW